MNRGRFGGIASVCVIALVLVACGHREDGPRIPKAISLSAGYVHACEVRSNGSLWCWGYGNQGQLGSFDLENPVIETASPQRVGEDYDWAWVTSGLAHNCAARTDGSLWCFGFNGGGELGVGSAEAFLVDPTEVTADSGWASASACRSCGQAYNLGIQSDGTLWAWGTDYGGRMGLDPTTQTSVPLQIGSDADWAVVDAGTFVSLAIKTDGTLWGWGENGSGLLGDGTNTSQLTPTQVGTDTDWAQISTGGYRSCAVKTDGGLWCWGGADGNAPVQIEAGTNFEQVDVGGFHTCAIATDGTLWCQGNNTVGQLGVGSRDAAVDLTQVGEETDWIEVVASNDFTCAIREGGTRWCWGYNWRSQLGTGTPAGKRTPSTVAGEVSLAQVATSTSGATVALATDGTLWEWGVRVSGLPVQEPAPKGEDADWSQVTAGDFHGCGLRDDASLWCWGSASDGALGNGTDSGVEVDPIHIGSASWSEVAAGRRHSCGIQSDGTLWCWGSNLDGQVGDGTFGDALAPTAVGSQSDWLDVSSGDAHTCGVREDGSGWCWGDGTDGQLGDGVGSGSGTPVQVQGSDWRQISAGGSHSCGTRNDGTLWCWGENFLMQLGVAEPSESSTPLQVGSDTGWARVDAGNDHTCAVKTDGSLWCWGDHIEGQAGVGGPILPISVLPTRVGSASDWVSVQAGGLYTCGVRSGGSAHCFGYNRQGQLGDASSWFTTPQPVE